MAFQLSPGVNVSEIDLTTIVPAVGTTEGAFAGNFVWGPVNEIRTIASETDLVNTFGKPNSNTFIDFFSAANFLSYARNLKVIRAVGNTCNNAVATGNGVLIENEQDYLENHATGANTFGMWAAKYPGTLGNSLKIEIFAAANSVNTTIAASGTANTVAAVKSIFSYWPYNGYFDSAPNTSTSVARKGGSFDEMHIVVIDSDGVISGTANTVIERFGYVSKASDAILDNGSSNYYKDVINRSSRYLWWGSHSNIATWGATSQNTSFGTTKGTINLLANTVSNTLSDAQNSVSNLTSTITLSNGTYGDAASSDLITAYRKFRNSEEVDVSLIITGAASSTVVADVIDNVAEYRKDCVVFVSPKRDNVIDNSGTEATDIINYKNIIINRSTSYGFMDSGWKYQFDKYNDTYRWVPLNGDMAGLCVRTDFERDPWFSPAGFNRGALRNVVKLAWNPNKTDRDELYKNGINPVVSFPGEGTILFGDKTMLSKPSAFDRINVRRLFIVLEKAIARAAKFSLFEFNDAFTRAQFVALVEPYLRDVQGRRGIFDYRVVCDETNNTPEVIDRNEFIGDIYIKPARSINFIQLNFVAVRTGVQFDEIVGRF